MTQAPGRMARRTRRGSAGNTLVGPTPPHCGQVSNGAAELHLQRIGNSPFFATRPPVLSRLIDIDQITTAAPVRIFRSKSPDGFANIYQANFRSIFYKTL
jgi:hypothetical protein